MEAHMLSMHLQIWLSLSYFITPGKYDWFSFMHMQDAMHMVPSMPHSEKKQKVKGHFFLCSSQNYADVETENPKTACQKLFKENLLALFSLFHS